MSINRRLLYGIIFAIIMVILLFSSCKTRNCPAYSNLYPGAYAEKHV